MCKLLVYGTILFDDFGEVKKIGGCATNFALHSSRLGCDVTMVSKVGNDNLGHEALRTFSRYGVRDAYIGIDTEHMTAVTRVLINDDREPSYSVGTDTAFDYIELTEDQMHDLEKIEFDAIYFGTLDQRNYVSRNTLIKILSRCRFRYRFYDINLRVDNYTKELIVLLLGYADILKLNDEELIMLSAILEKSIQNEAEVVKWLKKEFSIGIVIVTKNKNGATVYTDDTISHLPGIEVDVVDTVGAGDAFSAAFVKEYIATHDPISATEKGNKLGAFVATKAGAVPD